MTNPEHFRRVGHAHFNNYPINTFTNCTRMANVIAWNCNPKDPTSYYWDDKVIVNDLTNGRRIIDHTSTTTCRVDVSMYHMIVIVLGDHYDDSVIITDKSIKDNVRPYKLTEDDETLSNPNTESATTAITSVSQNVEYNFNTDDTSSEICSEETVTRTLALRRCIVKSKQYPSNTSLEHDGNNSATAIHYTTKEKI